MAQIRDLMLTIKSTELKHEELSSQRIKINELKTQIETIDQRISEQKKETQDVLSSLCQIRQEQEKMESIAWIQQREALQKEIKKTIEETNALREKSASINSSLHQLCIQKEKILQVIAKWKGKTIITNPAETIDELLTIFNSRQKATFDTSKYQAELLILIEENQRLRSKIEKAASEHRKAFLNSQKEISDGKILLDQAMDDIKHTEQQLVSEIAKLTV